MTQTHDISPRAMVGKEAPDFEAPAFEKGGFTNVRLFDYRGHWVMLFFYPGDFTFV
jgi:alkyl hydroperoxide reductase subunit AhpC